MTIKKQLFLFFTLTSISFSALAEIDSFSQAKRALYTSIPDKETFYTGCKMWPGFVPRPNLTSCGLQNEFEGTRKKRGFRIEAEHVIPSSWMYRKNGKTRSCFLEAQQKSKNKRDYCQEHDPDFRKAHNDLVNLHPTVGQVNADRSNKKFGKALRIEHTYGPSLTLDGESYFQPRPEVVGDIARIAFYMAYTYGVSYSDEEIAMFISWDEFDPISEEERIRNRAIQKAQGWSNPYISSLN